LETKGITVLEAGSSGFVRCTVVDTVLYFLLRETRHKIDDAAWFLAFGCLLVLNSIHV